MSGRIQLEKFMGRWGNTVIAYAVAKAAAFRLGATLETPDWDGDRIFGLADPKIEERLPSIPVERLPQRVGVACHGFWQFPAAFELLSRRQCRGWMTVIPELMALCPKPRPHYIACHMRRGDYLHHPDKFCVVKWEAFVRAVNNFGLDPRDILWLSEENPQPGSERMPRGLEFLFDFLIMMQADVLFRSNSTYSQCAGLLGSMASTCIFSPRVGDMLGERADVEFERGNHCANVSTRYHNVPHGDMPVRD